jgi:hypothetical protein
VCKPGILCKLWKPKHEPLDLNLTSRIGRLAIFQTNARLLLLISLVLQNPPRLHMFLVVALLRETKHVALIPHPADASFFLPPSVIVATGQELWDARTPCNPVPTRRRRRFTPWARTSGRHRSPFNPGRLPLTQFTPGCYWRPSLTPRRRWRPPLEAAVQERQPSVPAILERQPLTPPVLELEPPLHTDVLTPTLPFPPCPSATCRPSRISSAYRTTLPQAHAQPFSTPSVVV